MPKKRGKKSVSEEEPLQRHREGSTDQASKTQEKSRKKPSSRKEVDIESWIEKNIDEVVSRAGLDYLSLSRELWVETLRDLVAELYGSTSSYKSAEDIAKRLMRSSERILPIIATRLAQILESPSVDQLEFIVTNVGDSILELAPRIYDWVRRLGRSDLLGTLKHKWSVVWTKTRTPILPVACPRCGFNSLMPDLACLVCGASISERELKTSIDFGNRLAEVLSSMDCSEIKSLLNYDYVLVNDLEIKSPAGSRLPVDIEVYLSKPEKELVRKTYLSRCSNEAPK